MGPTQLLDNKQKFMNYNPLKPKVAAAITWADTNEQLARLSDWVSVAPRVYIHSKSKPEQKFGLFWHQIKPDAQPLNLQKIVTTYLMRIPGQEVCILAAPSVELGGDIAGLMEAVHKSRFHGSWAAFDRGPDKSDPPHLFILTAAVFAFMMRTLPHNLQLGGTEWRTWMHNWLSNNMLRPRYFEATQYGLVTRVHNDNPILNAYEIAPALKTPHRQRVKWKKPTQSSQPS